jgi:hypothetical protein
MVGIRCHGAGRKTCTYEGEHSRHGSKNTIPVIVAASTAMPRRLIGTAGTVHGAQLPGR